jgi:hypothetical protein
MPIREFLDGHKRAFNPEALTAAREKLGVADPKDPIARAGSLTWRWQRLRLDEVSKGTRAECIPRYQRSAGPWPR